MENKNAANKKPGNLRYAIDNLLFHSSIRRAMARLVGILRFIAFQEKNPKHSIIKLEPWHIVATFLFVYLAPQVVFINLMRYGVAWIWAGELALLLAVLEFMHALYDR